MKDESSVSNTPVEASSQNESGKEVKQDTVAYESFSKLLNQHKAAKAELADAVSKLEGFQKQQKQVEETKLHEQGEYQKLLELREKENTELRVAMEKVEADKQNAYRSLTDAQKLQAVCDKLPGQVINPKYLNFIDLDNVAYNPETGEIDAASVATVANAFMDEHKGLVDTSHVGRIPANASGTVKPLVDRFKDLSPSEMRTNMKQAVQEAKRQQGVN